MIKPAVSTPSSSNTPPTIDRADLKVVKPEDVPLFPMTSSIKATPTVAADDLEDLWDNLPV
ncbi:MAG: hypothetical protein AAFY31_00630 [Pseudomonadota bacterium]